MPETTETRPYHHGDLRKAVIETAMAMLAEGGQQFTLREIARRAGVSHAAPYKHFPDKASLLGEVALVGFDHLREALVKAQAGADDDLTNAFRAASQAYIRFGRENPNLYRLMFGGELNTVTNVHLDSRALGAFEVVIDLLERGQEAGLIRKRPIRGQAAACWAQLHGITMLMLDDLLIPEKVGDDPIDAALQTLSEGLNA